MMFLTKIFPQASKSLSSDSRISQIRFGGIEPRITSQWNSCFCALGQQSFGYLGGSTAHTIRPGLSWLLNLYFLPSREPPAAPLLRPKPQLQMNKYDIKADIGLAPRIWAHILPNFQIKQLLSLKWFQERKAFVAGNNPHILSNILGDRHLKVPLSWPQMYFVDYSFFALIWASRKAWRTVPFHREGETVRLVLWPIQGKGEGR